MLSSGSWPAFPGLVRRGTAPGGGADLGRPGAAAPGETGGGLDAAALGAGGSGAAEAGAAVGDVTEGSGCGVAATFGEGVRKTVMARMMSTTMAPRKPIAIPITPMRRDGRSRLLPE